MLINSLLFWFFSSLILLSSFFVVSSRNMIFSVLALVLCFFNTSCLLLLFELEFIPIIFIIIYVGAILVLFLFVLMMLNVRLTRLVDNFMNYFLIGGFIVFVGFSCISFAFFNDVPFIFFSSQSFCEFLFNENSFVLTDMWPSEKTNTTILGQQIFTIYCFPFLVAGLILLLAMISTISLTLRKEFTEKTQCIYGQIMKDLNDSIVCL